MEFVRAQVIDDLGRVLLPNDARQRLGWETGDTLSMCQLDANTLIIQLLEKCPLPKCAICKKHDGPMLSVNSADVCVECLEAVKKISF